MEGKSSGALRVLALLGAATPAIAQYVGTAPATPPGEPPATPSAAVSGDFSIYPKSGQTREQQAADLYQCYSWAKSQTGFDPTQTNGGVAASEVPSRREQYQRAMTVCLRARGYEVRYAAPTVPSAPAAAPPAATATPPPPPAPPPYGLPAAVAPVSYTAPELTYHPLSAQIEGGYTATVGTTNNDLDGGGNGGLGLIWFPTSGLPLGIRVDGSYSWFDVRPPVLGGDYTFGHEEIYGGDADVQLDLAHRSTSAKLYLFGGAGDYREYTRLKQVSLVSGMGCLPFYCGPTLFPAITAVERYTSDWHGAWNAGLGAEFALGDRTSFFVEARYLRILPYGSKLQFAPVRVGLRF